MSFNREPRGLLEQWLSRVLQDQPPRRAPHSLRMRVFAEIERRAALPWWRRSFMHWPLGVRALFLLASVGFVKLALTFADVCVTALRSAPIESVVSPSFDQAESTVNVLSILSDLYVLLVRSVPTEWLYVAALGVGALYLIFFGLSAAAYRVLYVDR